MKNMQPYPSEDCITNSLAQKVTEHWLLGILESNPAILDVFRQRDVLPYRDLLPWSGEFAGKYLTAAAAVYRLTGYARLKEYSLSFAREFVACMSPEGYLGCFQKMCQLTGAYSQNPHVVGATWDAWGHYHAMIGLCDWYDLSGESWLLESVETIAGFFLKRFYGNGKKLSDMLSPTVNLSVYHSFARLYQITRKQEYLSFSLAVEEDMEKTAGCPRYLHTALQGVEFFRNGASHWEGLHTIMGFAEMYRITRREDYLNALVQVYDSIHKTDVHNTGAFSTAEGAVGTPYINGIIETCCVVAYQALAIEALDITGRCDIADQLELAHYNAILGCFSPSGRWSTYNTPMEGVRKANYDDIHFQCRPGSPELNCCSVNAPRALGDFARWAMMEGEDGVYVNTYEPWRGSSSQGMKVTIEGRYPAPGEITVTAVSEQQAHLYLRIPSWSSQSEVFVNGQPVASVRSGEYLDLYRHWKGERIQLHLDFSPKTVAGGDEYADKYSIYCGPLLLGCDLADNPLFDWDKLPFISRLMLSKSPIEREQNGLISLTLPNGMKLRSFAALGFSGSQYKTWFSLSS